MESFKKVTKGIILISYQNKVLILLSLLLVVSCSVRRSEPIKGELNIESASVKNGREHYMHHCQKCHPAGEGGLGPAINSNPAPKFIKAFQVRHGLGVMPSFKKDEISKQDLKDILEYMQTLRHN